jgi:hypothetical protein
MYNNLDLNEFFKDEYKRLNHCEGIGASGIITNNQIINVYNDPAIDQKSGIEYLGLGAHNDILDRLIKDIYNPNSNYLENYYKNIITIRYNNAPYTKLIVYFIPNIISEYEFNNLLLMKDYYKEAFNNYEIKVGAYTYGTNTRENPKEIEAISNFDPIIDFASKRIDKSLSNDSKEKILKL